jgi:hypothetical protein
MAWGFRKSVGFGPFRINLSKSGIGASVGVKGARISTGPRGTYVNLGSNGFYYRKRLDGSNQKGPSNSHYSNPPLPTLTDPTNGQTILTTNFNELTDVDSQDFVRELEAKCNKLSLLPWLGILPSIILYLILLNYANKIVYQDEYFEDTFRITSPSAHIRDHPSKTGKILSTALTGVALKVVDVDSSDWRHVYLPYTSIQGFVHHSLGVHERKLLSTTSVRRIEAEPIMTRIILFAPIAPIILLMIWLRRVDKRRKTMEINYEMDESVKALYDKFQECFSDFASSKRIWQKLHAYKTSDRKYNAGASELVKRSSIIGLSFDRKPSSYLITNVKIPHIGLAGNSLYFFPERLVMKRGRRFAALQYKHFTIDHESTRFIETESVPRDSEIVDYTWKYVNKSGGPDRRFKDNQRIPICQYSQYHLFAENGLNEMIMTSRHGAMDRLAEFIKVIGRFQGAIKSSNADTQIAQQYSTES